LFYANAYFQDEKTDYEGLVEDFEGAVKATVELLRKGQAEDEDELDEKREELQDQVRALKNIPLSVIPPEGTLRGYVLWLVYFCDRFFILHVCLFFVFCFFLF
jgi:hypothetical protein